MIDFSAPIDLAHEPAFALGALTVRPSTREVSGGDAAVAEVLEPRVMQVLVALHRAQGAIVSRDDLTHSCWQGRVVGEDAINRVISRLRRTAEGIGQGSFRIETVTKVGYRLVTSSAPPDAPLATPRGARRQESPMRSRRALIGAGLGLGVAGLAFGGWRWTRRPIDGNAAEIAALIVQARTAITQLNRESESQAVGLLRRVVELRPDDADGWGQLAYAYVMLGGFSPPDKRADANSRAMAAAERAQQLDPGNPFARLAIVLKNPIIGNWLALDRVTRDGLARHPNDELMLLYLGGVYAWTGQYAKGADLDAAVIANAPPAPGPMTSIVIELWGSDRIEDADRAMDEAYRLFPLDTWAWQTRVHLLTYTGRADQALTMTRDAGARPPGVTDQDAARYAAMAKAMLTRAPADCDAAMRLALAAARAGQFACFDAIAFASAIRRLDDAFQLLNALFLDAPFVIGGAGPMVRIGTGRVRADRNTLNLFTPPMRAMWADPRFDRFCEVIGLARYWRESGTQPDYRRRIGR